jgi:hypothetical protein
VPAVHGAQTVSADAMHALWMKKPLPHIEQGCADAFPPVQKDPAEQPARRGLVVYWEGDAYACGVGRMCLRGMPMTGRCYLDRLQATWSQLC